VATVSRIDKIIDLFCTIASLLYGSFAKETYNFIDPTNCSHPIPGGPVAMQQTYGTMFDSIKVPLARGYSIEYSIEYGTECGTSIL